MIVPTSNNDAFSARIQRTSHSLDCGCSSQLSQLENTRVFAAFCSCHSMIRPLMSQASYQSEFDLSLSLPGAADFMTPRFSLPHDPSTPFYHLPPMTPAGVLPPSLADYGRVAAGMPHPYDLNVMTPSADPLLSASFGALALGADTPRTPGHVALPPIHPSMAASAAAYAAASPGAYAFAPFTPTVDAKLPPVCFDMVISSTLRRVFSPDASPSCFLRG